MREQLEQVLDEVIRPLVEADGGDVELVSVEEGAPIEVVLRVGGAYRGCPGTPLVTRAVFEPALAKAVGAAVRVRIVPRLD